MSPPRYLYEDSLQIGSKKYQSVLWEKESDHSAKV